MRYDPADRILSLSFIRDPREHADMMLEAGRRMTTATNPFSAWAGVGVMVGFGAIVGISMEVYRRQVLPLVVDPAQTAPLSTALLQFLPLIVLTGLLYVVLFIRIVRQRQKALISRLAPGLVVDVDIFTKGIISSSGQFTVMIDWPAIRDIFVEDDRIEIESEGILIYAPVRAFPNRAAFNAAAREIRDLWREAVRLERDRQMVAAGLD
ncbi:MAG: hypothetical protein KL863_16480 [Rhizobium sp.]|nr:hypothetical protein [Rhizobium sp.]